MRRYLSDDRNLQQEVATRGDRQCCQQRNGGRQRKKPYLNSEEVFFAFWRTCGWPWECFSCMYTLTQLFPWFTLLFQRGTDLMKQAFSKYVMLGHSATWLIPHYTADSGTFPLTCFGELFHFRPHLWCHILQGFLFCFVFCMCIGNIDTDGKRSLNIKVDQQQWICSLTWVTHVTMIYRHIHSPPHKAYERDRENMHTLILWISVFPWDLSGSSLQHRRSLTLPKMIADNHCGKLIFFWQSQFLFKLSKNTHILPPADFFIRWVLYIFTHLSWLWHRPCDFELLL